MKTRAVLVGLFLGLAVSGRRLVRRSRKPSVAVMESAGPGSTSGDHVAEGVGIPPVADGDGSANVGVTRDQVAPGETQHGELGGVPPVDDANDLLMGGSAANEDAGNLAAASAYSREDGPYDADVSKEGVSLTYHDPTDHSVDVPLDEGIPNLGEPEDVEDVGPVTLAEEATVDEVELGVPEEYGDEQPIDSVDLDDAWVADVPGEEDEIPAASRGLREYGEGDDDESDIQDAEETDVFETDEEIEPSGAGGEVDLENDEAPQGADEGLEIVDSPDEPLSDDAGGPEELLAPEETLGLRDSESQDAPESDDELPASPGATTSGEPTESADGNDTVGYSAAWSTPAGVMGEWPDQEDAPNDFPQEHVQDAEETSKTNEDAGDTDAGGIKELPVNPDSGGAEDAATSEAPEETKPAPPRKSRKQRRLEAMDWVPAGAVKGDGSPNCPVEYPVKGNANSRIYHRPSDPSYAPTIPEYCFATEEDAQRAGFRAPKG